MIGVINRFLERRRRPLTILATTIGGGYLLLSYIKSKLNEIQEQLNRDRITTENLRRRFHQNQDDCLFTVTALVPTIGNQILESMNVERLTDLLNQTKKPRATSPSDPTAKPIVSQGTATPSLSHDEHVGDQSTNMPTITVIPEEEVQTTELPINGTSASTHPDHLTSDPNQTNGLTPSNASTPPSRESVIDVLLRPDGTALRKRSEIWKEVMVLSFTRLFTCLYGVALLTMQTHIQLGLLGRDAYLSSIVGADDTDAHGLGLEESDHSYTTRKHTLLDPATEQRYLTFSWWYLHHGWKLLSQRIRIAVEEVLSRRSLKDDISLDDLSQIFRNVRLKVEEKEDGEAFSFSAILLPSTTLDELETLRSGGMAPIDCVVNSRLRELLNETQDFIDCDDFHLVLQCAMDRVTRKCLENVAKRSTLEEVPIHQFVHPRFTELANDGDEYKLMNKNTKSSRFVTILPVITRESHQILNLLPNEYTDLLSQTSELKEFSSVIYTSFDHYN